MSSSISPRRRVFERDLSAPEPIPEEGIARAEELMRKGLLFRYGEDRSGELEVAKLEAEFAEYLGVRYAVAVNSCGCSLFIALKSAGVQPGDQVLMNAFTLAPVPGAVEHAGAKAVLVEVDSSYLIDIEDLERKAASGARVLMLSHMRGHIADMDALSETCQRLGVTLIEDCAHTLGARWNGRFTGTFGKIGCFSFQAFKHLNCGEGGIIATDDEDVAARAILYSGSYMLYAQHGARPPLEVFERHKYDTPNFSMRMSNLAAAVARPQLKQLPERGCLWNERYALLEKLLGTIDGIEVPARDPREEFVASSIQFSLPGLDADEIEGFLSRCDARGVHIKWFGRSEPKGFTSRYVDWGYISEEQALPKTLGVLRGLCDMRIPLSLTAEECRLIASIIGECLADARTASSPVGAAE